MRNKLFGKICWNVAIALVFPLGIAAQGEPEAKPNPNEEAHVGNLTGHAKPGAAEYYRYCWGCHGARGNGDGENAPYLTPTPRNFVAAVFKCRSTPTGTLPLDSDLYDSINRGFNFTNMPSWIALTAQQKVDLVAFIKTFSARWVADKPGTPIQIPAEPTLTIASIKHGAELYRKLECWKCHGQQGRGDGPSAPTLTDSNDQPIRPYDFTTDDRAKCGQTNQDLYRIFMTGLDGTPMPSFADAVKPADAWDLVHYLRTLQYNNASPELTLWESTPEGKAIVAAQRVENTNTGSGIKP